MSDEVDVEALQRMNVEYAAALRTLLGEDFDTVLDEGLVTRRDGTVVFVPPETATDDETEQSDSSDDADSTEAASEADKPAATRPPISKLPATLTAAGGSKETKPVGLRDMVTMSPSDFEAAYDKWIAANSTEEIV